MQRLPYRYRIVLLGICTVLVVWALPAIAQTVQPFSTLPPPQVSTRPVMPVPTAQRSLVIGDSGNDVYWLKIRMQELGYFNANATLSSNVSKLTLERLNKLLANIDMEPVEVITPEIQDIILTRDDLYIVPTPAPTPTLRPLIMPQGMPELPPLDAEGFLAEGGGEYIYSNEQDGLWYYISDSLFVNVRRYENISQGNIWCEAEVRIRGDEQLLSFYTPKQKQTKTPVAIARENQAVLAFTDDFFTMRRYGVAIRDGEVYRDYIRTSSTTYPRADTLAVFEDGSMLASEFTDYRADDFLAMGAVHVLSFGPWLVSGGEINPRLLTGDYMYYHEPRMALGMIAPGHYLIIAVDGRYDGARGVYLDWLARRMHEAGVMEANNLDGGGTTALVFMGKQISRVATAKPDGRSTRQVMSLLGFGVSNAVSE